MTAPDLASLQRLSNAGRTAEVFAWDETTVLKLARDDGFAASFAVEMLALEAASSAAPGLAPAFRGPMTIDGRPGFLMERLSGIDLLTEIEKKPWRIWRIGRELADAHARLHRIPAPAGLHTLHERLARRLQSPALPPEVRERALKDLDALPAGAQLCHVDFHPGNLMRDGSSLRVIDFSAACAGHPDYDHAATLTLLELGELPPGTPSWMRMIAGLGRRLLIASYTRRYRKLRTVEARNVAVSRRLFLAQRLDDGIAEERERILRRLAER